MFRLRTFGSVGLQDADGRDLGPVLAQPKRLALLIYLAACRPQGAHRRDALLARFWPDLDDTRARDALNQALRFLRQALGAEIFLRRGGDEVGVDRDRLWCDVVAFHEALSRGRPAEALELYRGEFLQGFFVEQGGGFEEWLEQERSGCREAAARGARELAEQEAEAGAFTQAVAWGRRAMELAPDDERALRRLLRWYDRAGDRAGAFRAYEAFTRRFEAEFGSPLSPETEAMAGRLRAGKPLDEEGKPAPGPAAGPLTPPQAGNPLGDRYRIERKLGAGGMAVVYLAEDLKHGREVALKVLRAEVAEGLARERFLREIRIAGRLQHPNIVPLFDSGEADGRLFYVMPHVDGETLRERLRRDGRLPVGEAVHLLRELAGALAYAHGQGVVHRDIKPENVLLIDRRAVLSDFGIARAAQAARTPAEDFDPTLTQPGTSLGTPSYMAPEQAAGKADVDHRADLYALGVVAYEMIAGMVPFTGSTPQELLAAQLTERPRQLTELRPEVPVDLAALVMQCLEKPPERRPQSAAELLGGLATGADAAAAPAGRPPRWRFPPAGTLRRIGYVLLAVVVAGLGIRQVLRSGPGPTALGRLAVLYFEDGSPDGSLRWLARGLTEDLIDALAGVSGLTVTSRNAVRPYEGRAVAPQALGRALDVGLLIDGTVEPSPDSIDAVVLVVRLVDATTGVQLERETLTRSAAEQGVLRRDLARLVELSLRRRIGAHVQLRADRQAAGSDAAWELVRRARELRSEALQLENGPARDRLRLADSLLARAEADSGWVEPTIDRAALALVRVVTVPVGDSAAAVLREGIGHADRALRRIPESPRALAARGELLLRLVQFGPAGGSDTLLAAARENLLTATALDPGLARAWYALMDVEQFLGHEDESYLAGRKALAADIYATEAPGVLTSLLNQALGKPDRPAADTLCAMGRLNFPANPNFQACRFTILGWLGAGRPAVAEAGRWLRELDTLASLRTTRDFRQLLFAALLARAGLGDSARAVERRVLAGGSRGDLDSALPVYQANLELQLGRRDRALQILAVYAGRDPARRLSIRGHPWFRGLRSDPAFQRATGELK